MIHANDPTQHVHNTDAGLMRIALMRMALSDPLMKIAYRNIDSTWAYEDFVSAAPSGFHPYRRVAFVPHISALARWLRAGATNDRAFNENDLLTKEALFLVHDYLHCWSAAFIQQHMPDLQFGTGVIDASSFEKFVFCHLLTEAAATVGLDYWYLSTVDLDHVCQIGTRMETLTTSYRERDVDEYRRHDPELSVQSPEFFSLMSEFYCDGEFPGFSVDDIKQSPKLLSWLKHEISYGEMQRIYTRSWLSHLSNGTVQLEQSKLGAKIVVDAPWQEELIDKLGAALWAKVKDNAATQFDVLPSIADVWQRDPALPIDFRFTNANLVSPDRFKSIQWHARAKENAAWLCTQVISNHEFKALNKKLRPIVTGLREKHDVDTLLAFFQELKVPRISVDEADEPLDIFVLG